MVEPMVTRTRGMSIVFLVLIARLFLFLFLSIALFSAFLLSWYFDPLLLSLSHREHDIFNDIKYFCNNNL